MDRGRTIRSEHEAAMPVGGTVAGGLVLRAAGRERGKSRTDAASGRAVHANSILRCDQDDRNTEAARSRGQSEASAASAAKDGIGGDLSETATVRTSAKPSHLSIPLARCNDDASVTEFLPGIRTSLPPAYPARRA